LGETSHVSTLRILRAVAHDGAPSVLDVGFYQSSTRDVMAADFHSHFCPLRLALRSP